MIIHEYYMKDEEFYKRFLANPEAYCKRIQMGELCCRGLDYVGMACLQPFQKLKVEPF